MIIVTGSSDNHFKTLKNLMNSFVKFYKDDNNTKLIVFNLGISLPDWDNLIQTYNNNNIIYKTFNYDKYPPYLNININAGEYAWKPIIVYNVSLLYPAETLIWMDAGNLLLSPLNNLYDCLQKNNIHSGETSGNIVKWTHPLTIKYMNTPEKYLTNRNRNGACVGFNVKTDWVKQFIKEWHDLALTKECIAPDGSSRKNHRQDQAVLTSLYYKYQDIYKFESYSNNHWKYFMGYSIHNDVS